MPDPTRRVKRVTISYDDEGAPEILEAIYFDEMEHAGRTLSNRDVARSAVAELSKPEQRQVRGLHTKAVLPMIEAQEQASTAEA